MSYQPQGRWQNIPFSISTLLKYDLITADKDVAFVKRIQARALTNLKNSQVSAWTLYYPLILTV